MPASCGAVLCVHARRASASQIEQLRGSGRLSPSSVDIYGTPL